LRPFALPGHRTIDEAVETVAAPQASLDCGLDDVRGEECERQGHPDGTGCRQTPLPRRFPYQPADQIDPTVNFSSSPDQGTRWTASHTAYRDHREQPF
jgi:hypothetical protein